MDIIALNRENIITCQADILPDIAENIGRTGYHGIMASPGNAVLIWRQSSRLGRGEILLYTASDAVSADALLAEYEKQLLDAGIARSELELPADLGMAEQEALQKKGYILSSAESNVLHTTVSQLASNPIVADCKLPQVVESTGMLDIRQFRQGILSRPANCCLEDAENLSPAWFEQTLSCDVQIAGKVCGCLLIHRLPSGALRPELFYITAPAVKHNLLDMIRFSIITAHGQLDGSTPVVIPRCSDAVRALTDKLFPGLCGDTVLVADKELSKKGV